MEYNGMKEGISLHGIYSVMDKYFQAWNDGFVSKNADAIRAMMSSGFAGYWAHSGLERPDQYGFGYDLEGVLSQYGEASKSYEISAIQERREGREVLVLGREINLVEGTPHPARFMFVWRLEDGQWKLAREYIELEK